MTRRRLSDMPPAQQAGILCHDERFRDYVGRHCLGLKWTVSESAAAEWLRGACRIDSRRVLDRDDRARQRFECVRTDFDAWRGRIARPP